ncbi:MAG: bifunctional glutamate N-acetyltransferase/amino-acid acetyltransferase ArgJ [Myxococcales bacterium]|nr:bifunctional glutamate N-acetyltransferase/amino-acid acetyltransferase ArgJ [Myxococcales bacterium]
MSWGDWQVPGFRFAGIRAGIKKSGVPDLGLIVADAPVTCAGVFTQNLIVAAPVTQSRARLAKRFVAQAVVVNSGNANACTGEQGARDAAQMAAWVAQALDLDEADVQVCSTGVIGQHLPMARLEAGIPDAAAKLSREGLRDFATAIMTTDTRPKVFGARAEIGGRTVTVAGASKGAGMIHPNMATMLGFVCTDAEVAGPVLDDLWRGVCQRTFNAITIDGDTSTNDTALCLASGEAGPIEPEDLDAFVALLEQVAGELARAIIRDAEGGTKLVAVTVSGAPDFDAAQTVANAIALSPLVKTAIHGQDPNWGRIIAAAGRSGVAFTPTDLRLWIDDTLLYAEGRWQGAEAEAAVRATMQTAEYGLRLDLGAGLERHTVFTCDFSADYVRINADYRS